MQNNYDNDRDARRPNKRSAFTVKPLTVELQLDVDMAEALGSFILVSRPQNPAIAALGHQLQNIIPFYEDRDDRDSRSRDDRDDDRDDSVSEAE